MTTRAETMLPKVDPTSQRERAKGSRRMRIVDATCALLREVGMEEISVKMIADEADVSPATVYNLFGTKGAILENVYARDLAVFEERVAKAKSADSLDRIFDAIGIAANLYRADPHFYRATMSIRRTEADTQFMDAVHRPRAGFWCEMVRKAANDGHLRADTDADRVGVTMIQIAAGALADWVSNLISIEQLEQETIFGFAAVLSTFATKGAQPRLLERLEPVKPSVPRKRSKSRAS